MIRFVNRDAVFIKRRKVLLRAGGRAALAAEQADRIIDGLIAEGPRGLKSIGRPTKYGEGRIKNCLKYDLGNGYRLVGLKREDEIVFLYIGAHDDCNRWIVDNKGARTIPSKNRNAAEEVRAETLAIEREDPEPAAAEADRYGQVFADIDEKDLREIFCGLTGTPPGER